MEGILIKVGLIAIAILIIYIVKKIDDYNFDKKTGTELSEKVYAAAKAFAEGSPAAEIRGILINSIDFAEEDIEEVLSISSHHKNDADGGYQAFLNAARQTIMNY
jgi:hypothetical protein